MAPKKKVAPAPIASKKAAPKKETNPLFEKRPKNFGLGGAPAPKRDLRRFVKWPKYVRIQRQRRVLSMRLKVPPVLNQFVTRALDKNQAETLFKLMLKYRPENKKEKADRLKAEAAARESGKEPEKKKPLVVKFGLNHVTTLVESGKAQLVVIAHDVDPIELVVWLPALCRKMGVPYCIVKGKARLGAIVHQKNAAALALTAVKNEDQREFAKLVDSFKSQFNEGARVQWGGGIMGIKSQHKQKQKERVLAKELAQRAAV
jgi:large subunit ribosomal protein L7Ae